MRCLLFLPAIMEMILFSVLFISAGVILITNINPKLPSLERYINILIGLILCNIPVVISCLIILQVYYD